MFKNLKISVLVLIFAGFNICGAEFLQRLALPAAAMSVAAFQANKVANCNGRSSEVNPALFGIHKSASDFVRDPLDHSVTKWRRSRDWKDKIRVADAHEDTDVSGYQFDGFGRGHGSFSMQRRGDMLHVKSKIVATNFMGTSPQNGLNLSIGGINIAMHSGTFKFEQSDLFTKCVHTIQVGEKPADKLTKVLNVLKNRASCDNPYCNDKDCIRLKDQANLYDTMRLIRAVIKDDAPKVVRTSKCTSVFDMREVSSSW